MDALFALPVPVSAGLFILGVVALSLASYALARAALSRHAVEETRDLAGSVLFRMAALHGLVLALVFAQELGAIRDVDLAAAEEAALLGDVYYDLRRYGGEEAEAIQGHLARYGRIVLEEEWGGLAAEGRLSLEAWHAWEAAYEGLLALGPADARQDRLLDVMLGDVRALSELREARENAARGGTSGLFLVAAISGVALISAAYFTWPPTALNLALIAAFAGYTGLVVYFVVAFANPYRPPGAADPVGFERFLTPEVRAAAG